MLIDICCGTWQAPPCHCDGITTLVCKVPKERHVPMGQLIPIRQSMLILMTFYCVLTLVYFHLGLVFNILCSRPSCTFKRSRKCLSFVKTRPLSQPIHCLRRLLDCVLISMISTMLRCAWSSPALFKPSNMPWMTRSEAIGDPNRGRNRPHSFDFLNKGPGKGPGVLHYIHLTVILSDFVDYRLSVIVQHRLFPCFAIRHCIYFILFFFNLGTLYGYLASI